MQADDNAPRGSDRRGADRRKVQLADLPFPDRRSGVDRRSGEDRRRDKDRRSPA